MNKRNSSSAVSRSSALSIDDVIAAIDIEHLPRHQACGIVGKKGRSDANIVNTDKFSCWRLPDGLFQKFVEFWNARRGTRRYRSRRNRVDANSFGPSSAARYRTALSSAAFATPMML